MAPEFGWPIFCSSMAAISSGIAHIPLPIWARPGKPQAKPTSTFQSSYACIQACCFISDLGTNAPANIEVCNSSPVLSRKPVLINTTLFLAIRIHSFKLTVVLRSSSMIPSLIVSLARLKASSIRLNSSTANATSSGPCILGFTILIDPARLFVRLLLLPLRS